MRGADEGWSLAHLTGTRNVVLSHKRERVCVWGVWVVIIVQALFPWLSMDFLSCVMGSQGRLMRYGLMGLELYFRGTILFPLTYTS